MIATEFKCHCVPCFRDFIRIFDNVKDSVQQYENGDCVKVWNFLMENIVKSSQSVSLKALHKILKLSNDDWRYHCNSSQEKSGSGGKGEQKDPSLPVFSLNFYKHRN